MRHVCSRISVILLNIHKNLHQYRFLLINKVSKQLNLLTIDYIGHQWHYVGLHYAILLSPGLAVRRCRRPRSQSVTCRRPFVARVRTRSSRDVPRSRLFDWFDRINVLGANSIFVVGRVFSACESYFFMWLFWPVIIFNIQHIFMCGYSIYDWILNT